MFIITFRRDTVHECAVADSDTVFALASMLEQQELPFKVSNRLGCLLPVYFGWGSFKHWLQHDATI